MTINTPELTLIQISDPHLRAEGELMRDRIDTAALLDTAIETVRASGVRVHALLLTGDLTDDGKPDAYRRLKAAVEPFAKELDAELVYVIGNHDEHAAFAEELLSTSDGPATLDAVHWVDGLRIVALDTTLPGRHDGRLDAAQLDWLRDQLATPAPRGSLLVLHHPPLPSPVPTVHLLRMHDSDALAEVLAGTDVRLILAGHAHHTACGTLAGIPVWVCPALPYQVDALPPANQLRAGAGAGISRIDLIDGRLVVSAVALGTEEVYAKDEAQTQQFIAEILDHIG